MSDSIYHMTLRLTSNHIFGVKMLNFFSLCAQRCYVWIALHKVTNYVNR